MEEGVMLSSCLSAACMQVKDCLKAAAQGLPYSTTAGNTTGGTVSPTSTDAHHLADLGESGDFAKTAANRRLGQAVQADAGAVQSGTGRLVRRSGVRPSGASWGGALGLCVVAGLLLTAASRVFRRRRARSGMRTE